MQLKIVLLSVIPLNLKRTQILKKKIFLKTLRQSKFNLRLIKMLNYNLELLNRDLKY
jgi:hypothetical protein